MYLSFTAKKKDLSSVSSTRQVTNKIQMQDNILIQFLKNHPALTVSKIAEEAGFSKTLLYGILSGEKALKASKAFAIAKVLSKYGLELNGWIFEPYIIPEMLKCYRFKDGEQATIDKGDHFEYQVVLYRDVMDEGDFARFIGVPF